MGLSHFDDHGASRMVNVGEKSPTRRVARATAAITMLPATLVAIQDRTIAKGDVFEVARLAGIMAAKRTDQLIPLCHILPLEGVTIDFRVLDASTVQIDSTVQVTGKTGVEMEALTAVSVAALTLYDMCKSIDRAMTIKEIRLEEKTGGKSGRFVRQDAEDDEQPN